MFLYFFNVWKFASTFEKHMEHWKFLSMFHAFIWWLYTFRIDYCKIWPWPCRAIILLVDLSKFSQKFIRSSTLREDDVFNLLYFVWKFFLITFTILRFWWKIVNQIFVKLRTLWDQIFAEKCEKLAYLIKGLQRKRSQLYSALFLLCLTKVTCCYPKFDNFRRFLSLMSIFVSKREKNRSKLSNVL